jgi:prepilin-type N-terminal cleavage/methylation domain-containing protein
MYFDLKKIMKKNAFTLIELLVVIVIIGILASIGVSQFNKYQEKARIAKAQAFAAQVNKKALMDHVTDDENTQVYATYDFDSSRMTNYGTSTGVAYSVNNNQPMTIRDALLITEDTPTGQNAINSTDDLTIHHQASEASNKFDTNKKANGKQAWTYSLWFKLPNDNMPNSTNPLIHYSGAVVFTYQESDKKFYLRDKTCPTYTCTPILLETDSYNLQADKWYHLMLSFNSSEALFYLDGNLIGNNNYTDVINTAGGAMTFFDQQPGVQFSDLRIYQAFMGFDN